MSLDSSPDSGGAASQPSSPELNGGATALLFVLGLLMLFGLAAILVTLGLTGRLFPQGQTESIGDPAGHDVAGGLDSTSLVRPQSELDSEPLAVWDLKVGDCWIAPKQDVVDKVGTVPCAGLHDLETYAIFVLGGDEYPGEVEAAEMADLGCADRFEDFTGEPYSTSLQDFDTVFPSEQTWDLDGDRAVVCSLVVFDRQLEGLGDESAQENADGADNADGEVDMAPTQEGERLGTVVDMFSLQIGDCFDLDSEDWPTSVTIVPCVEAHDVEVYELRNLSGDSYPGDATVDDLAVEACTESFEEFVQFRYVDSELDFYYFTPTERSWIERDDREVVCAATAVDGSKLMDSVQGAER